MFNNFQNNDQAKASFTGTHAVKTLANGPKAAIMFNDHKDG